MKFIYNGESLVLATAPHQNEIPELIPHPVDLFLEGLAAGGEWAIDKIVSSTINFLGQFIKGLWDWFILNLPDIMGYLTIAAGVGIIIGSMFGQGGMMRPLAVYAAALILAFCILGGV